MSTEKHRAYLSAQHVREEGRPIEELGPVRLAAELDELEREGEILSDGEFDARVKSGRDFFGRKPRGWRP